MNQNTWFPIKILIVDTGEVRVIEWEEIPNGITFKVLETRVGWDSKNTQP